MNFFPYFIKPEYIYNPRKIFARMLWPNKHQFLRFAEIKLPWGLRLRVRPNEVIGTSVLRLGVYDLVVSETIWRLLSEGGCALDIGANIGHMSSIMAARAGLAGTVHSFEPHPQVYQEFAYNVHSWSTVRETCRVHAHNFGLSDMNGEGIIEMPESFDGNRGVAFVVSGGNSDESIGSHGVRNPIQLRRLDDFWSEISGTKPIDVVKIDVEGHELSVLKGAANLIGAGMIRDIVFEENRPYPTDVTDYLSAQGYSIFLLEKGLWGPLVSLPVQERSPRIPWEPPAYLATRDPSRASRILKKKGWFILASRPVDNV